MTGRMIGRYGRRRYVLGVLTVWMGGILLMLIPSVPVIVFALAIASMCGVMTQAASTSYVAITAQGGTSSAVGLYVTSFYIGGTFGGWLAGLAYEAAGWSATVALVVGMLAVMATVVATTWSRA
jgi:predicted MFS family arabinose efflux permease